LADRHRFISHKEQALKQKLDLMLIHDGLLSLFSTPPAGLKVR
jgi:hypothetical protein